MDYLSDLTTEHKQNEYKTCKSIHSNEQDVVIVTFYNYCNKLLEYKTNICVYSISQSKKKNKRITTRMK